MMKLNALKHLLAIAQQRTDEIHDEDGHAYAWGGGGLLTIFLIVLLIILLF